MIWVGGKAYELVQEHKEAWKPDAFKERYSEVLDRYDYIVGDWGYNQLRLKGFFKEGNGRATKDSTISSLQDYLQEYCNFGCAYFVLERVPGKGVPVPEEEAGAEKSVLGTDAAEANDEPALPEGESQQRIPGVAGGMAFSDRKPYSWREHQSPSRLSGRNNADRSAAAADKAETADSAPAPRRDARPGSEPRRGSISGVGGGRPHDGKPDGRGNGGGYPPRGGDRPQGKYGGGRKFHKGPGGQGGHAPNPKAQSSGKPQNGGHGRERDQERMQQRHFRKPQPPRP